MRDQTAPDRTSFDKAAPDQTVNVTFTPPESWTFTPDDVKMTAAGKVILLRTSGQSWSWVSASVKDDGANQFHPQAPNGAVLNIQDDHTENGSWSYTVTVNLDGTSYTSPDPQITNKEPP
jgi:hypothetical protein